MRKVEIPIGETVTLKLGLRGAEHRVKVLDLNQDLVLIKVPPELEGGKPQHYVTLEFTTDQYALWLVPTTVHSMFHGWWYLARPDEHRCQVFQRRVFPRVSLMLEMLAIPVDGELKQDGAPFPITFLDLSASGCRVAVDKLIRERTKFVLVLALPEAEGIPVIAEVVRSDGYDGKQYRYGIQFVNLRSDHVEAINAFVQRRIENVIAPA